MTYTVLGGLQGGATGVTPFILQPLGGAQDDGPQISAAMAVYGWIESVPSALYTINSPIALPNNRTSRKIGFNGSMLKSTLVPTGGPGGYLRSVFLGLLQALGTATTVAVQPTKNTRLLQVTNGAVISANSRISVGDPTNNVAQQYFVLAVVGNVLQLDQPILYDWQVGEPVQMILVPQNIEIEDAFISGTGDRAVEIGSALNCTLRNIRCTRDFGGFSSIVMSFDVGSQNSRMLQTSVDGAGTAAACYGLESAVGCYITDYQASWAQTGVGVGVYMPDCRDSEAQEGRIFECLRGAYITEGGSIAQNGSSGVWIRSTSVEQTTNEGILITGYFDAGGLDDVKVANAGYRGISIGSGASGSPVDVQLSNVTISQCVDSGLAVVGGKVSFTNLTTDGNCTGGAGAGIILGPASIMGANWRVQVAQATNAPALQVDNGGGLAVAPQVKIRGLDINQSNGGTAFVVAQAGTGLAYFNLHDGLVRLAVGVGAWVDWQSGVGALREGDLVVQDGANGVYMGHAVSCTLIEEPGMEFLGTTTPYTIDATARCNRGTCTANGAGLATYSWPNLQTLQAAQITQIVGVATPYVVTYTPGVGLTIQGLAAAQYAVEIN